MNIKKIKEFAERIPEGLSQESRKFLIKEYFGNNRDYSHAVQEAVEIGRKQEVK